MKSHILTGSLVLLLPFWISPRLHADEPAWWGARGIKEPGGSAQDYAPVVMGQLKWMATNAAVELDSSLNGGAGSSISNLIAGFGNNGSNFVVANVGQVKEVARPFYDRLIQVGYTTTYPWTGQTNAQADFALANLGQLKALFSFQVSDDDDMDAMYDWWEISHWGTTNQTGSVDYDADGIANSNEYRLLTSPTLVDTDADGMGDSAELLLGADPVVSNLYSVVPFMEPFEATAVLPGDISGQNGWTVTATNQAHVQSGTVYSTNQALEIPGSASVTTTVTHLVGAAGEPVIWSDMYVKPAQREIPGAPSVQSNTTAALFINENGQLVVYDGNLSSNNWVTRTNHEPVTSFTWSRITIRHDYGAHEWDLWLDAARVASNLGFAASLPEYSMLNLTGSDGQSAYVDSIAVTRTSPFGAATLSGSISYGGTQSGNIYVMAAGSSNSWTLADSASLSSPSVYTITNLASGYDYWVKAFRDVNGNMKREVWEPSGAYPANPLFLTTNAGGVNLALIDPVFTVSGVVSYDGTSNGTLRIVAVPSAGSWATNIMASRTTPGAYILTNLVAGSSYWIKAYRDSDANGAYTYGNPLGHYPDNPILAITQHLYSVDITLGDDFDSDGLEDIFENNTGIYGSPTDTGSDPADSDSDGDGLLDGDEVDARTNPNNADTLAPTVTLTAPSNNFTRVWWP